MRGQASGDRLFPHSRRLLPLVFSLAAAAALTAITVALYGASPTAAMSALARGAVGSTTGLTESLLEAIPLLLTGLGVALAFRAHLWNIGAEGQLLVGSLAGVILGTHLAAWPPWLLLPAVLTAGAVAGAAWAAVAAALRIYRAVPEVIATIMLNFVALHLVSWAVTGPLREPGQDIPRTRLLPEAALLPPVGGGGLHSGLFVSLAAVALVGLVLYYTVAGFRIRAVGLNRVAAAATGLPVARTLFTAFCMSGAMAGLAGAVQLAGVTHRVYGGSSPGTGYTAVAVALVGGLHPVGVMLAAFFFGGLTAGSNEMQRTAGVSSVIASVIQAIALLVLIAGPRTRAISHWRAEEREESEGSTAPSGGHERVVEYAEPDRPPGVDQR